VVFYGANGKYLGADFNPGITAVNSLSDLSLSVNIPAGTANIKVFYWGADFIPFYAPSEFVVG
jgi:hypothetical protein